jgi:hypothetical protein
MIDEWNELYPNVDVLQELRKMKGWSNANPAKERLKKEFKDLLMRGYLVNRINRPIIKNCTSY